MPKLSDESENKGKALYLITRPWQHKDVSLYAISSVFVKLPSIFLLHQFLVVRRASHFDVMGSLRELGYGYDVPNPISYVIGSKALLA